MRIMIASVRPPAKPEIAPYSTPIIRLTSVATMPTVSDTRAP